jgi:transcriptional regulator with XRE-family HTH domain
VTSRSTTKAPPQTTPLYNHSEDFSTRLRAAQRRARMSNAALARAAGISLSYLGYLRAGRRPSGKTMLAVAAALGVSPQWLAEGDDAPTQCACGWTDEERETVRVIRTMPPERQHLAHDAARRTAQALR